MSILFTTGSFRRKFFCFFCSSLFAASMLFCRLRPACATTVLEQTFPELVQHAEVIAIGTVTGITERWDARRRAPFTDVTFANLTVLKGDAKRTSVTLEFLGGRTPEGTIISVAGVPQFTIGEKNVIFCAGNRKDFCPLVGVWQGRLHVRFDPQRKEETISDNFHTPIIGVHHGIWQKRTPETAQQPALSLSTLIDFITQELQAPHAQLP